MGHLLLLFFFITKLNSQTIISETELPISVNETSGLEIINNNLVTLNDSRNQPNLYYISKNGEIFFVRSFDELQNNDWEDITADNEFIYIADIGNNYDTRSDLNIIKVPINVQNKSVEIINFYYPEQDDFSFKQNSYYDAESLISYKNHLLIFTKNRAKQITEIYRVPKVPGNYKADLIGSIDVKSVVTAADFDNKKKLLVLTSTHDFNEYYIIKIKDFNISKINNLKFKKHKIPLAKTQVEAIKIINKNNFWITSEAELFGKPKLYKISL